MAASVDASGLTALCSLIDRFLDSADDGVYGVDRDGRATLVTPTVAALTGHAVDELVGRAMHEVLHHSHPNGDDYPQEECPIYAAFRDGKVHHAEEVFWRKDGTSFPIAYTSTPIVRGSDVVGAVVVFRDLTRRRAARDGLRRLLDRVSHPALARATAEPKSAPGVVGTSQPVGTSAAWRQAMNCAERLAGVDTTVLLLGESGTGKELVANAIHQRGPRRGRPLVKLSCAAIPASLIESELFGHERGAFTDASTRRIGRFEQAGDGTLFLDEVGELSLEAQAKLLRVLQEREFERVGGTQTIPCRARIIAATNRDLAALVATGHFRADLYYRLNVFPLRLPPLRDRREDIPLLVDHFLADLRRRLGRTLLRFSLRAERQLLEHDWPGNVRELQSVVERAALLADGPVLETAPLRAPGDRPLDAGRGPARRPPPADSDGGRAAIHAALEGAGWKVTGTRGAAAALGMHPNTLRYRMQRLGIRRPG